MMQSTRSRSFALLPTTGRKLLQDVFVILLIATLQANLGLAQEAAFASPDQTKPANSNSQQPQAGPQSSSQQAKGSIPQPSSSLVLPAGTKLPLGLVRPISVTKSKPGDSVYLQITFPITAGHQMLVPPGTYVQGIIGKIIKRDRTRALLSFSMRSASMIFSTGYTVSFAGAVDTLPTIAGLQAPATGGVQTAAAPVAMTAVGTTAPPPLPPAPSLGNGARNTMIGIAVAGAVGTALAVLLTRHQDVQMEAGTPLEIILPAPLQLDRTRIAEAVQQYSTQAANTPPAIVQPPKKPKMCYDPGTPSTPDTVIPGSPGTPPTVIPGVNGAPPTVIPGTPATPDTVIPGTPGTPGREYPCK
jgi:hypothetical protein